MARVIYKIDRELYGTPADYANQANPPSIG
jgi:hypothetical protein